MILFCLFATFAAIRRMCAHACVCVRACVRVCVIDNGVKWSKKNICMNNDPYGRRPVISPCTVPSLKSFVNPLHLSRCYGIRNEHGWMQQLEGCRINDEIGISTLIRFASQVISPRALCGSSLASKEAHGCGVWTLNGSLRDADGGREDRRDVTPASSTHIAGYMRKVPFRL